MNIHALRNISVPSDLPDVLRRNAELLPPPEKAKDFGKFFDRFGDARVVLLGEATHGTSEFYRARSAITRHLITNHGFNLVAVESDWPDAAHIDAYARHLAIRPKRGDPFIRFPTWMWRNVELLEFADWLRSHNEALDQEKQTSFRGLDIYSLGESMHAVLTFLDKVDPRAAAIARSRYSCLTPWQDNPQRYGRVVMSGERDACENDVVEQLSDLLGKRIEYMRADGAGYFDAEQNARIVRAAEQYYRSMYRGAAESWNLRDRHMFDTLQALMAHHSDTRAVVWAHNSHIGNASATAMGWRGEFNIGQLCRMAYGDQAVLVGFGTDTGKVAAASDWDGMLEIKNIRPARGDSYEFAFRQTGLARTLTSWRGGKNRELIEALSQPMLERAIGVIYRPETELTSHYFEAVMAEQFDAYVWFEQTSAVTPLGPERPEGAPETYPFGL